MRFHRPASSAWTGRALELGRKAIPARWPAAAHQALTLGRLPDVVLAGRFDTVISNSLLHHLSGPMGLGGGCAPLCTPSAAVFVMELVRPDSRAAAERLVAEHAVSEPQILRRDFLCSLLAAYRPQAVAAQLARTTRS